MLFLWFQGWNMWESTRRSEEVAAAAALLLARYPPRKVSVILDGVLMLCGRKNAEAVVDLIYRKVGPVDTPWPLLRCPSAATQLTSTVPHYFIAFEYNRIGECYRCPLCNQYVSGDRFVNVPSGISGVLRQVESAANRVFAEYAELYYGKKCTVSAYTWECDPVHAESKMGLAVLIQHRAKALNAKCPGYSSLHGSHGVWQSAHVGVVDVTSGSYRFQSSFCMDAFVPLGALPNTPGATGRFNGSVASGLFGFERYAATASPEVGELLASIGEQVQSTENSYYGRVFEMYFRGAQFFAEGMRAAFPPGASSTPQSRGRQQPAASVGAGESSRPADADTGTPPGGRAP
ncbi:F-actin capping protein beta subunit [Trypanosoma conorhini]|uniref:F-actin-capping protein subunit beta n=1 Tax=Trypanosoma conorhini TaxID=83891 RepID=A0A3S5IRJ5_9TRYP|nr:F-actin capping protein beta subunit [Trypanosoma conorhini]RNF07114.1 F-actin capping protein beta subunit [Trypanosoma conorhini]